MTTCTTEPVDLTDLDDLPAQRTSAALSPTRVASRAAARKAAVARYGPEHGEELVGDLFDAAVAAYLDARVTTFIPVLVERRLREALQQR